MRLEWLEDILAVAQTGSFSEAAERRHLTQSAFSRRIQNIEEQVGAELFDRSRKPVHLHDHVEAQRDQIAHVARLLRQLQADLRRGGRMAENKLILTSQHSLTTSLTPSIIREIGTRRRDIFIRLRSANLTDCFAQLLSRQAAILIVYRLPGQQHPILETYVESITLGSDRFIPVIAPDTPAARGAADALTDLPYVAYPADVFFGDVFERQILPKFRDPNSLAPKAETALTLASLEMAQMGVGVAWVPESLARPAILAGRLADLSDRLPHCALEVTGVRLVDDPTPVEAAVWEQLSAFRV
ncbi:MAG: LysR family transcriptional regulator [Paracoccaceae bacterium]|nr:LysR family transcriptional regulator [Paracoccaceae bacterium]MDE3240696.1 LysR family transcriptional regulator [Paracoccaceae bacterium]